MYKDKTIGVVIPAYNEELLIDETISSVPAFVDRIYVVNDGSTDNTYHRIVSNIVRQNGKFVVITHEQNRGVGAAIVTGYKEALAEDIDIAVVMGGDNQMDPARLPDLLAPLIDNRADYAKGNRMSSRKHLLPMTNWRRFGNWLLRWLTRIASGNYKLMDPQNGYTAITRRALRRIDLEHIHPGYGYCNDILVKLSTTGDRICEVAMPARYGREKSKIKYSHYIPRVSWLLVKEFLWRLRVMCLKG
jgi:glycosyltransferase involved in cell wall biosynthesis